MRDKELRKFLKIRERFDGSLHHETGLTTEFYASLHNQLSENFYLLLNYLNLEIQELSGRKIVKKERKTK